MKPSINGGKSSHRHSGVTPDAPRRIEVKTRYLGEHIDVKGIRALFEKKHKFWNHMHPLVMELGEGRYVAFTRFGAVSFWDVSDVEADRIAKEISPFITATRHGSRYTDTIIVYTGATAEKVTFEEVHLAHLGIEEIKIISYVSAQSVALERYEEEIDERLQQLGAVVQDVKERGETTTSPKDLLRQVGNVLSVKQRAVSSLSLFDKPDETWKDPDIGELYVRLRAQYELRDRFEVLNEKINFLSENNITLLNFISSQRANALEVIVIVLIVFEILLFLLQIFLK